MTSYVTPDPDDLPEAEVRVFAAPRIAGATDDELLDRLAGMSRIEYDRRREEMADRLGVRVSTLDTEVKERRGETEPQDGNDVVFLDDPEPWPEPVQGGELLSDLVTSLTRHMILPAGAAEAIALWIVHAHAHGAASISPILAVTSPTPECGKTTLLMLLGALVPRPLPASSITAAALFRAIEKWLPTLLVDEADTFLKDSDELRGVINSGHNRLGAWVIRTTGENHEPRSFRTWAPKAIALIGDLPPTLHSRSIHIRLRRMSREEHIDPLRGDRLEQLEPLRRQAWRWAADNARRLADSDPPMPSTLRGRSADNWRHLFAIADLAGEDWPQRARKAAESLSAAGDERSASIMLLSDLQALFRDRSEDRLASVDIIAALGSMEDRPWSEWRADKPITVRQLARLLDPFGIRPGTIRTADGTSKGYLVEQFAEAFRRYLPDPSVTP